MHGPVLCKGKNDRDVDQLKPSFRSDNFMNFLKIGGGNGLLHDDDQQHQQHHCNDYNHTTTNTTTTTGTDDDVSTWYW